MSAHRVTFEDTPATFEGEHHHARGLDADDAIGSECAVGGLKARWRRDAARLTNGSTGGPTLAYPF